LKRAFYVFCTRCARDHHGLRRRKNCALFVAGTVTDLFIPSSATLVVFVTQLGGASAPDCSNAKPNVSADGHENIRSEPERTSESEGRVGK